MSFTLKYSCLLNVVLVIIAVFHSINAKNLDQDEHFYRAINNVSNTFQTCDKRPEKVYLYNKHPMTSHLATTLEEYDQNKCIRVIQGTDFSENVGLFETSENNGFVNTVIKCYTSHHNLVIRPDDIWIAIISQFSYYVNANSERLRGKFVNFDGKKTLEVHLGAASLDSVSYTTFVQLMEEKIHENIVDDEIRDWITPNFTTTIQDDKTSAGVIFMATLKKYFNYRLTITCGIPKITLEGTIDDWKNIQQRLSKLKSYDLETWVTEMLEPILEQFVRAKQGDFDQDFWSSIVTVKSEGCGGEEVSGWITAFNVFDYKGRQIGRTWEGQTWPVLAIESINSGVVEVDVTIDDNGKIYNAVMFAGHLAYEVRPDGYTLQPKIGWAIALKEIESKIALKEIGSEIPLNEIGTEIPLKEIGSEIELENSEKFYFIRK